MLRLERVPTECRRIGNAPCDCGGRVLAEWTLERTLPADLRKHFRPEFVVRPKRNIERRFACTIDSERIAGRCHAAVGDDFYLPGKTCPVRSRDFGYVDFIA